MCVLVYVCMFVLYMHQHVGTLAPWTLQSETVPSENPTHPLTAVLAVVCTELRNRVYSVSKLTEYVGLVSFISSYLSFNVINLGECVIIGGKGERYTCEQMSMDHCSESTGVLGT